MSAYSDLLQKYISERDVKVVKLHEYCASDRSSMYKIINGKRKPTSFDIVRKIANYLQLSPSECEAYYDAYYKSMMGEEEYEQRQQIAEFICDFNHIYSKAPVCLERGEMEISQLDNASVHMLQGKAEINYHLRLLLEKAAQNKNPVIKLLTQYDNQYLKDTLLILGKNLPDMRIEHILCFQKQREHTRQNIDILKNLIPFYGCECKYEPYYYYDEIVSHFYNMNLFCNVVICKEGVICYTSDYAYGQMLIDKECIKVYGQLFEQYRSQTYPLLTKVESVMHECLSVGQNILNGTVHARAYAIHAEPCVIPFISEHVLRKQIKDTLPGKEQIIKLLRNYIVDVRKNVDMGNFCSSFTLRGIEKFIKTGKMTEVPEYFYDPIEQRDCVEIIRKMLPYFENGTYRLLKNKLSQINNDLHIFASPSNGHLLFSVNKKDLVYVYMNEPGMIHQFLTFMKELKEDASLYMAEEAVEQVRHLIEKYE